MSFWQVGLLVFAALWGLLIAGTPFQMRHYRATLARIAEQWSDGFVGSGAARARFGAGAIAIVVVGPTGFVRQVLAMHGHTVFAKFKPLAQFEGMSIGQLRESGGMPVASRLAGALKGAVAQIDRIAAERAAQVGEPAVAAAPALAMNAV